MAKRIIKGVKFKWCKFNQVDQYGKYSCQVDLTKEQAKEVKSWGLKVKKDDEGNLFLRLRKDQDRGPVSVIDSNNSPVTVAISNGAYGHVILDVYEYKKFGGGIACRLEKVKVLQWEPYGEDVDFDDDDDELPSPDDDGKGDELF